MCEWSAAEILGRWSQRSSAELQRLGAAAPRVSDDGGTAIIELAGRGFRASVTAWSTGMLELVSTRSGEPEVLTEQRHGRAFADAVLDEWLGVLERLARQAA